MAIEVHFFVLGSLLNLVESGKDQPMPKGARIIHVGKTQFMDAVIFAECDINEPETEFRHFRLVRTGKPIPQHKLGVAHIGSIPVAEGRDHFHLYEINPRRK